jgi:ribonucleoside-triphosphate reductase (thioredoxin)
MNITQEILSDIVVYNKYAKYLPTKQRRETWKELVTRNKKMHQSKFPKLKEEIEEVYEMVYDKKVLPSMRSLQFAGKPIDINNSRIFNCSYLPIDDWRSFSEVMFLLLSGCGVGYSVQKHHIEKLPEIRIPKKTRRFLVGDSIEGWADSVKVLMKSYFGITAARPIFDFRDIRPKGAELITVGGKAPGPEPLKECLFQIQKVLDRKEDGSQLTPIEAHDIICHIADAVLSGGIRRAALISLFDLHDNEMLTSKHGTWWELNPQRGRANNSAVVIRSKVRKKDFFTLWSKIVASNSGEPGIYFSDDKDWGTNPCCEIALRPFQFCNLTEINVSNIESQEDLNERVAAGAFLGTLQASYTDFHYLRSIWQKTTEKDALVGVGMTGIGSGKVLKFNLEEAAKYAKRANEDVAKIIGIKKAARVTTVKPSGTSSLVLGTSSGIHAWHNDFYVRRMRLGKNEALYQYLAQNHPELVEDDFFKPDIQAVVSVPQKAPEGAIYRTESPMDLLERTKKFNVEWVKAGHRKGANTNNVSATISVKQDEWDSVGEWMWKNKHTFNGLSVLPYDNGSYTQAPFEDITKSKFLEMESHLNNIDLRKIVEMTDETDLKDQAACAGGACEIV